MAMAFPLPRIARSMTFPLTISALEVGNRDWMLGGRPTWRAFSKSAAYAMGGLLMNGLNRLDGIFSRIGPGGKPSCKPFRLQPRARARGKFHSAKGFPRRPRIRKPPQSPRRWPLFARG